MQADWPVLDVERDHETFALLHLAAQMIGKVKLAHSPWLNHGWHIALQPVAGGLATLPIDAAGRRFGLALDLCELSIRLTLDDGTGDSVALTGRSVAEVHGGLVAMLERHGLPSRFDGRPNELEEAVPFAEDGRHLAARVESGRALRGALAAMLPVFEAFRARFQGKSSPAHFFWGSFDLALSRFSGRRAPAHGGGIPNLPLRIAREAYSHEVASSGFWAGGAVAADPMFYAYVYPEPDGYREGGVAHGRYDAGLGEYVLPYAEVRAAADPAAMLREFFDSAYALAADRAGWDRAALECSGRAP